MDGTTTDGRKGIAYLRDHFAPALLAEADADDRAPQGAGRQVELVTAGQVPV